MKVKLVLIALITLIVSSCGSDAKKSEKTAEPSEIKKEVVEVDPLQDKGVGIIKSLELGDIDEAMVAEGEIVFKAKCSACHKITKRFVGPGLAGVTERRTPEWIMNMILDPELMVAKNQIAKDLLAEYLAPMANQNLTEIEARQILEYLRTKKAE